MTITWTKHRNTTGVTSAHAFTPTGSLCRKVKRPNGESVSIDDNRGIACAMCLSEVRRRK